MNIARIIGKSSDYEVGTEKLADGVVYVVISDKNGKNRWMKKAVVAAAEKKIETEVKYVVVQTGYTSRLLGGSFKSWSKKNNVMCIKDALWGKTDEITFGGGNYTKAERDLVSAFLNKHNLDGVAVFQVSATENDYDHFVDILGDCDYCSFCEVDSIYRRKTIGQFHVIDVDCESG